MQNLEKDHIVAKKYQIVKKIGSGSFGYLYACKSLKDRKYYALKIEKKDKGDGQLKYEIKLYQLFKGVNGITRMYDYGYEGDKLFMVIDLLDRSLQQLFQSHGRRFTLSTVLNIGIQILTRIEVFHSNGYLHRDIKANNFMVGRGSERNIIYIIDFGLAKKYRDSKTGKHIPFRQGKSLVGTARYTSIASHLGYEQGRKDDLQSIGFLLLYFLRGKLPWQGIQLNNKVEKYAQIGRKKRETSIKKLCETLPVFSDVFVKYFQYVRSLQFADTPDYQYCRQMFLEAYDKVNDGQQKQLEWIKQAKQ